MPRYDKSLFGGEGDRVPVEEWGVVNSSSLSSNSNTGNSTDGTEEGKKIKLVIFEGWCVGFRALDDETLRSVWEDAVRRKNSPDSESGSGSGSFYNGRLGYARFEDVRFVNEALRAYDDLTELVYSVHLFSSFFSTFPRFHICIYSIYNCVFDGNVLLMIVDGWIVHSMPSFICIFSPSPFPLQQIPPGPL